MANGLKTYHFYRFSLFMSVTPFSCLPNALCSGLMRVLYFTEYVGRDIVLSSCLHIILFMLWATLFLGDINTRTWFSRLGQSRI
jgi:hypothetical protein